MDGGSALPINLSDQATISVGGRLSLQMPGSHDTRLPVLASKRMAGIVTSPREGDQT